MGIETKTEPTTVGTDVEARRVAETARRYMRSNRNLPLPKAIWKAIGNARGGDRVEFYARVKAELDKLPPPFKEKFQPTHWRLT